MSDDESLRKHARAHVDDPDDVEALVARVQQRLAWRRAHGHKVCSACGQAKKPEEFGSNPSRPDGLHDACLDCERRRDRSRKARVST